MSILSEEEIRAGLLDFYQNIDLVRKKAKFTNRETEAVYARNAMVDFLLDNLTDDSTVVDMMSGELIVPLAVLFLQKEDTRLHALKTVYAVDDNNMSGLYLMEKHIEHFGMQDQVVQIRMSVNDPSLVERIGELTEHGLVDATTVIDGSRYPVKESFFDNLAKISPVNLTVQWSFIPIHYKQQLAKRFDLEQGTVKGHVQVNDIQWINALVK